MQNYSVRVSGNFLRLTSAVREVFADKVTIRYENDSTVIEAEDESTRAAVGTFVLGYNRGFDDAFKMSMSEARA